MKKSVKFGGRKRFDEGGSVLRSTDGELVRFGYEDDDEYQKRVNADKAAQGRKKEVPMKTTREAMEEAIDFTDQRAGSGDPRQRPRPPAPLPNPSKPKPSTEYDVEEPGSAGFSRTPLKDKPKPVKKKTEESKPPAGAFRGIRSEGGNYKPSAAPKSVESKPAAKTESASVEDRASRLPSPNKKAKSTERPEGFLSSLSKALTSGGREFTGGGREFGKKHGGKVHKYAKGGSVGSASKRADGIAQRGKTRGVMR